jgi:hypothetical protein
VSKALAETGMSHLSVQYIQPPEHLPSRSPFLIAVALSMLVIDLSSPTMADVVCAACEARMPSTWSAMVS